MEMKKYPLKKNDVPINVWKTRPFKKNCGHGCEASYVVSDTPPPYIYLHLPGIYACVGQVIPVMMDRAANMLKSMYIVLVNSEKQNFLWILFVELYRSKSLVNRFVWNHQYFEKMPLKFLP